MKVVVGSKNPIKLQVAVKVFLDVFPDEEIKFITCDAQSGVSDQPYGTEETKTGAYNRAQDSFYKNSDVDYSVGLEGGIEIIDEEYWVTAWMCVLNREGKAGYGRTSSYQLPPKIVDLLKEGKELSDAGDIVLNDEKIGQKGGVIGVLTDEQISRADFYSDALRFALLPFTKQDLYK